MCPEYGVTYLSGRTLNSYGRWKQRPLLFVSLSGLSDSAAGSAVAFSAQEPNDTKQDHDDDQTG